ncbi:MAG: hypothetical protein AB7S88_02020 [Candidatus Izemoplasmatales bacterium]
MKRWMLFLVFTLFVFGTQSVFGESVWIEKGVFEIPNGVVSYGFLTEGTFGTNDAYFSMTLNTGEKHVVQVDLGMDEVFVYGHAFNQDSFVLVRQDYITDPRFQTSRLQAMTLCLYDANWMLVKEVGIPLDVLDFLYLDDLILIQTATSMVGYLPTLESTEPSAFLEQAFAYCPETDGTLYLDYQLSEDVCLMEPGIYHLELVRGWLSWEYDVRILPRINGIPGELVTTPVRLTSDARFVLDGITYEMVGETSLPGRHIVTWDGHGGDHWESEFVIGFTIDGVEEGLTSKDPISIFSNALSMTLDGDSFSGGTISNAGSHELVLYGLNDYVQTVQFTILPSVRGVEDEAVYASPVTLYVNGTATLNGETIANETEVSKAGTYELKIWMDDIVVETIHFGIESTSSSIILEPETTSNLPYLIFIGSFILIGIVWILRKKG